MDPSDKRSRLAVITEAGRKAWQEGARVQAEAEEQLVASLSADDAARLADIIEKLRNRVRCTEG